MQTNPPASPNPSYFNETNYFTAHCDAAFSWCYLITDAGITATALHCPLLTNLDLRYAPLAKPSGPLK